MRTRAIPTTLALLLLSTHLVSAGPSGTPPGPSHTPSTPGSAPPPAPAPVTHGVIAGKVVRQDGTPAGFVDVSLEPEEGYTYSDTTLTDADGTFRFPSVPVGNYKLTAFADGHGPKESFARIGVTPGSAQNFVITLVPIDDQFVSKIPLQNKRLQDIVFLYPGATRTCSPDSTDISIGGGTSGQVGYRANDMGLGDPVNGGPVLDLPTASIESFKLITGGFSAQYGEQSSGVADILSPGSQRAARQPTPIDREAYAHRVDNAQRNSIDEPLSTFAVDVDTASYSNVRRFLAQGRLPPPDAVRIEELVNYFRYEKARTAGDQPFGATTEIADCPWAEGHQLLRVSLTTSASSAAADAPRSLVFLIDVSGSMGEPAKLPLVQQSLRLLVERLRARDEVGIVVYAGAAGLVLPLTPGSEKQAILSAIDRLSAGGSTNGAQGIQLAYQLAETARASGAMSRVILATDGDFNVGVTSEGDLVRLIEQEREKGIALTVLGFGTGNLQDARMEALADHGNGNYAYVDSIEEARKVLDTEMTATLVTVAKDVKIQIEFNPAAVREWKLIGYENRLLAAKDFADDTKDAGEVGAGHQVTALYELVPAAARARVTSAERLRYQQPAILTSAASADEIALLRIRWKAPEGGTSRLFEKTVSSRARTLDDASPSLRFAAAVAAFGLRLRASDGVDISWQRVRELAASAAGHDEDGLRSQFVGLVEAAARLQGEG